MPTITSERRGDSSWRFTISVPTDCLPHYPRRLLRKTVKEPDKLKAHELAYRWAADMAAEFRRIRETGSPIKRTISDAEIDHLTGLMVASMLGADEECRTLGDYADEQLFQRAAGDLELDDQEVRRGLSRGIYGRTKWIALDWLGGHGYEIPEDSEDFRRVLSRFARASAEAIKAKKLRNAGDWIDTPSIPEPPATNPAVAPHSLSGAPLLSQVIAQFMAQQDPDQPMQKKYATTTAAFLECVGDRPVDQLKQMDVENFFETLCKLPPQWAVEKRRKGVSLAQLAEMDWERVIAPKTFKDTYQAALQPFLNFARRRYGDQGFPPHLTARDGIKYLGDRDDGENKQRAMKLDELKRLFAGSEMLAFASDPEQAHCYWLPAIGLYTGARVNEVCQLNPQTDIAEEAGIWFFHFTEETEGDERIRKSLKNNVSRRRVPIHSRLLDLGLLAYVKRMKDAGATLLFPQWPPTRGKASGKAEKWFRQLIIDTGLRDETPKLRLVGFHAFRSTFENRAMNLDVKNAEWLTGHAGAESAVIRGYRGEAELQAKQAVMERISFDVEPPRPIQGRGVASP